MIYTRFIRCVFLFILLTCGFIATAQQGDRIDSLLNRLFNEQKEQRQVRLMVAIGYDYLDFDRTKASYYGNESYKLARKASNDTLIYKSLTLLGEADLKQADYTGALRNFYRALRIADRLQDVESQAGTYNDLGIAHYYLKDYPKALNDFQRYLDLSIELGDSITIGGGYNNVGLIYEELGNLDLALVNYRKSLFISEHTEGGDDEISITLGNIGHVYAKMDSFDKAIEFCERGLHLERLADDQYDIMNSLMALSEVYVLKNDRNKAFALLDKALAIAEKSNDFNVRMQIYEALTTHHEEAGQFEKALDFSKKLAVLRDSSSRIQISKQHDAMMSHFEVEKKYLELSHENEIQQESFKRNRIVTWILSALGLLLITVILLLSARFRNKQREQRVIEKMNRNLTATLDRLQQAQAQLVSQQKLAGLGRVMAGIAHEIQNPINFIYNFSLNSKELIKELNTDILDAAEEIKGEQLAELKEIITLLETDSEKINQHSERADAIVKNMLAHSRAQKDEKAKINLKEVLAQYAKLAHANFRLKNPQFQVSIETYIDPKMETVVFNVQTLSRVFLNLINNSLYAVNEKVIEKNDPTYKPQIRISTRPLNDFFVLSVRDNGPGLSEEAKRQIFEPFYTTKQTGEGTGLGLSITYELVKSSGGKIDFLSEEGAFTEFIVSLPHGLKAQNAANQPPESKVQKTK